MARAAPPARRAPSRAGVASSGALSGRLAFLGATAAAGLLAFLLAAAQLLPALPVIGRSDRSTPSLQFFGSGSLRPSWSSLLLVPDLFGGDGVFHQPIFFTTYNLAEVTGYVGLLPLVAFTGLLARSFGRRRDRAARDWLMWHAVALVGLVLAFGTFTPLGVVLAHLPFYGGLRLQSRNLTLLGFGLGALLGFFVDERMRVVRMAAPDAPDGAEPGAARSRWRRLPWQDWLALAPAIAAVLLLIVAIVLPGALLTHLGVPAANVHLGRDMAVWFALELVIALAVVALVARRPRWDSPRTRRAVVAVVAADLLLFGVACSTAFYAGDGVPESANPAVAAVLGSNGRFALVNPDIDNLAGMVALGQPDLNALVGHASVQGYGSIVAGPYDAVTGAHLNGTLSACALETGVFTPLDLATVLAWYDQLAPQWSGGPLPSPPPSCHGVQARALSPSRTLFLGATRSLAGASPHFSGRHVLLNGVRVGVVTPGGTTIYPKVRKRSVGGIRTYVFDHPVEAVAIVATGVGGGRLLDTSSVVDTSGRRFVFTGAMQDALGQRAMACRRPGRGLRPVPHDDAVAHRVDRVAQLVGRDGAPPVDGIAGRRGRHRLVARADVGGAQRGGGAGVARHMTNLSTGQSQTVDSTSDGLVQAVWTPPGRYRLRWSYWPPGLSRGLELTGVGLGVLVVALLVLAWRRRRPWPFSAGRYAGGPGA